MAAAEEADEREFMRHSWSSPVYSDAAVVITASNDEEGECEIQVPAIRYELAKASRVLRAQIERWSFRSDGAATTSAAHTDTDALSAALSNGSTVLRVSVEGRDELIAMQQLLEFIHTRELPEVAARDGLWLFHLIRLANFYSVAPLLEAAATAVLPLAPQMPGELCAALFAALQPLVASGSGTSTRSGVASRRELSSTAASSSGGGSALQRAAQACLIRLDGLMSPLSIIFSDPETGQVFDALPLAVTTVLIQPTENTWVAQETAFLAGLRWLEANTSDLEAAAAQAATQQLLGQLEFSRIDSAMLLVAAQTHPVFQRWRGAGPSLAAAVLAREAGACLPPASSWRRLLSGCPGVQRTAMPAAQPLLLELKVPLEWLQQEAARLQRTATEVQERQQKQATGKGQEEEQAQAGSNNCCPLTSHYHSRELATYRGYIWVPSLALTMIMPRGSEPEPAAQRPPPHAIATRSLRPLLRASLLLQAQALPTLLAHCNCEAASSSGATDGSPLLNLGPLAQVTCATATADACHPGSLRWETELTSSKDHVLFPGAYCTLLRPLGVQLCTLSAFEARSSGHMLPDLSRLAVERSLHFRFTISMRP